MIRISMLVPRENDFQASLRRRARLAHRRTSVACQRALITQQLKYKSKRVFFNQIARILSAATFVSRSLGPFWVQSPMDVRWRSGRGSNSESVSAVARCST